MQLTKEEKAFLEHHNIPEDDVFDGTNMSTVARKAFSKETGKRFLIGAPCGAGGHRLKAPNSTCIQCKPSAIAFKKRFTAPGKVYVAHSASLGFYKIGYAVDLKDRKRQMNEQGYGGARDWRNVFVLRDAKAGEIEARLHKLLSYYSVAGTYRKEGKDQKTKEMYKTDVREVVLALKEVIKEFQIDLVEDTRMLPEWNSYF